MELKNSNLEKYLDLGLPVKSSTGTGSDRRTSADMGERGRKWSYTTIDGALTFWGVYNRLLLDMQNERRWLPETCERYDEYVCDILTPIFMKDGRAFADLTEEDILRCWQDMLAQIGKESVAQPCHLLLRTIMQMAYDRGYTRTLLWGMVNPDAAADLLTEEEANWAAAHGQIEPTQDSAEERLGMSLGKVLDNKTCMMPEEEYLLYLYSEQQCGEHGEYLGVMIASETGNRTSEVVGYSYDDLVRIGDCYALRTLHTSAHSSRDTELGGKTDNTYRYADISNHLAEFLRNRKKAIEDATDEDVGAFPMVCVGTNYKKRCNQAELNRAMKDALFRCKADVDNVRQAGRTLRDNPDIGKECEFSSSLYLMRHQRMTWAAASGYSQGEIYNAAGHKLEVPNVEKPDFSNPDVFERLHRLNSCRPLIQALDNTPTYEEAVVDGRPVRLESLGWMRIRIPAGKTIQLVAQALEPDTLITADCDNAGLMILPLSLPAVNPSSEVTMRKLFHDCAQSLRNLQTAVPRVSAPTALPDRTADEGGSGDARQDVSLCLTPEAQAVVDRIERAKPKAIENTASSGFPTHEDDPLHTQESLAPVSAKRRIESAAPKAPAVSTGITAQQLAARNVVYIMLDSDRIVPLPESALEPRKIGNAGTKGVVLRKKEHILCACLHDSRYESLILSAECAAYRVPANVRLDQYLSDAKQHEALIALCRGGVLLPLDSDALDLVLVSRNGCVRTIPSNQISAICDNGRKLPSFAGKSHQSDVLHSAFFCAKDTDPFLVGSNGKALRLIASDIFRTNRARNKACRGISLDSSGGELLASALSYPEDNSVIVTTAHGMSACVKCSDIMPHHKGTQGSLFFGAVGTDRVISVLPPAEYLLLIRSDGYVLCFDATQTLSPLGRGTKGRVAMRLKHGQTIVAALPLHMY